MLKKTSYLFFIFFFLVFTVSVFAQDSFTFAVFGDSRPLFAGLPQGKPFKDIINEVELVHPNFMIDVGDLVYGYMSDEKEVQRQYQDLMDTIKPLTVPFYAVVGNHEIAGKKGEKTYTQLARKELYYSFTYNNSYFVVIDTDLQPQPDANGDTGVLGKEQINWLTKDLEKNKNIKHKFAFMHRPMFGNEKGEDTSWTNKDELKTVEDLFKKYKIDIVFAGHWHTYRKFVKDGIIYYVTGGGGAEMGGEPQDSDFLHYLLVKVKGAEVNVKVIQPNGLWADYITENDGKKVTAKVTAVFRDFANMRIAGLKFILPALQKGEDYKATNCKIWDKKDNGDGTATVRASVFLKGIVLHNFCTVEIIKK